MRYYFAPMGGGDRLALSPGPPPLVLRGGPVLHALSFAPAGTRLHPPGRPPISCLTQSGPVRRTPAAHPRAVIFFGPPESGRPGLSEVNLNLGCPSGTVVAKGKGSGLLGRREELERLLDGIYARAGIPVSIKTRLGLRDPEEFFPLLELFNRYPVCELIIHPRVQKDFYRNQPRLDAFAAALASCRAPVCYNGDLVTAADCSRPDPALSRRNGPDAGPGAVPTGAFLQARGGPGRRPPGRCAPSTTNSTRVMRRPSAAAATPPCG